MVGGHGIEPIKRITRPGSRPCGPRCKLILDWSPEQICGWLKNHYPEDESMRVSHETIYRSLFIQARGGLKKELIQHLRSQRRIRRSRHSGVGGQCRGQLVDARRILRTPGEIKARAIP